MELEQFRSVWQQYSPEPDDLDRRNRSIAMRLAATRVNGHQHELSSSIRHTGYIGLTMTPLAVLLYLMELAPAWFAIVYALFGLGDSIYCFRFASQIVKSDYFAMPTVDALACARHFVKRLIRSKIVGFLLALPIIVYLFIFFEHTGDTDLIIGGCVGGCIGLAIGIRKLINELRHARSIVNEFECDE